MEVGEGRGRRRWGRGEEDGGGGEEDGGGGEEGEGKMEVGEGREGWRGRRRGRWKGGERTARPPPVVQKSIQQGTPTLSPLRLPHRPTPSQAVDLGVCGCRLGNDHSGRSVGSDVVAGGDQRLRLPPCSRDWRSWTETCFLWSTRQQPLPTAAEPAASCLRGEALWLGGPWQGVLQSVH